MTTDWKQICKTHQEKINSKIPKEWLLSEWPKPITPPYNVISSIEAALTPREIELTTKYSATELAEQLKTGNLSSYELTYAICKRAAIAHQYTNCLCDMMFEEALARAKELDDILKKTGKPVGPMHGLPLSIKDHMTVKGVPSPTAYVAFLDNKEFMDPKEDGVEVRVFRDAGCVFYCKTTNPMGLMVLETVSSLNGRTLNPFNTRLTSGGSSGGECSLIGAGGSLLGITTDIGGSIRVPAAYQGLYALKPSGERWVLTGGVGNHFGMESIKVSIGPAARSWDDLNLFMESFFAAEPWKYIPSMPPMPWKSEIFNEPPKKLKIALFENDGFVTPHPPIIRALHETVKKLKAAGHEVVEWKVPDDMHHKYVAWDKILLPLYWSDGAKEVRQVAEATGEPFFPSMQAMLDEPMKELTIHELWKYQNDKNAYRAKYLKMFVDSGVDAILTPIAAACSYPHDFYPWWGYSAQWNFLDYPCSIVPAGKVDKNIDTKPTDFKPFSDRDQTTFEVYDPELYDGQPIALQIVCKPFEEEKALLVAKEIDNLVNKL